MVAFLMSRDNEECQSDLLHSKWQYRVLGDEEGSLCTDKGIIVMTIYNDLKLKNITITHLFVPLSC